MSGDARDSTTTAELRGELFGVHIPELQLPIDEYRAGLRAAGLERGERYLELGSGHGIGLVVAAGEFGARATGVEYLQDAIETARAAAARAGVADRVELVRDDLRQVDPTPFDVVHMHLGPAFHDVLAARMERLLTQHARVVAAGWRVPGWLPVPGSEDAWDGGYVYRPADPRLQASWGERGGDDPAWVELHVHADLNDLEPRLDGAPAADRIALDRTSAGRGTTVLVQLPRTGTELSIWARCRAGRLTQRGPTLRV
ncbi:MAG: methyltransferase domain-containing protein [Thermoleophilia bacterium]|nr:methyltransferase domain-containing protein [Thermoleophilia bacterium]